MKKPILPVIPLRAFFLLFFVLAIVPSCELLRLDTLNPYNDLTSDHLQKYRVKKIRIVIPDSAVVYPGATFPLGVIAETRQKDLKTRGFCNGFVNWNSYLVKVEGGYFEDGIITVNPDPRFAGDSLKITVTPFEFPELKQQLKLALTYKRKYMANCKGHNGLGGINGLSGNELKRMDTTGNHPANQPYKGQTGTDGERGADGCIADVFVKSMTVADKKLMNVLVINHCNNDHFVFWIDPDGGSLLVDVSGGDGGNGGSGGDGGKGIDGAGASYLGDVEAYNPPLPQGSDDPKYYHNGYFYYVDLSVDSTKNPGGNGGDGGVGGNGGNGGYGGNGGVVVIHLDSSAAAWKNKILINNSGGKGGKPGMGGWAGGGGRHAYGMINKHDGDPGYIGAEGKKGKNGELGSAPVYRIEKVKMAW